MRARRHPDARPPAGRRLRPLIDLDPEGRATCAPWAGTCCRFWRPPHDPRGRGPPHRAHDRMSGDRAAMPGSISTRCHARPRALDLLDARFLHRGHGDIIARKRDQHVVNQFAAFCAIAMARWPGRFGPCQGQAEADPRAALHGCLDWMLSNHLAGTAPADLVADPAGARPVPDAALAPGAGGQGPPDRAADHRHASPTRSPTAARSPSRRRACTACRRCDPRERPAIPAFFKRKRSEIL